MFHFLFQHRLHPLRGPCSETWTSKSSGFVSTPLTLVTCADNTLMVRRVSSVGVIILYFSDQPNLTPHICNPKNLKRKMKTCLPSPKSAKSIFVPLSSRVFIVGSFFSFAILTTNSTEYLSNDIQDEESFGGLIATNEGVE